MKQTDIRALASAVTVAEYAAKGLATENEDFWPGLQDCDEGYINTEDENYYRIKKTLESVIHDLQSAASDLEELANE